ncbi:IclR family transcriptional regulator [Actinomadura roseirufa]|uniref:IclR family transcriptional regulator n=1 Tax=Actinomadura roseirufa TaxID=2094049 RepID=UPI0010416D3D|nr:helix-turn-helix domain-containing protein [Actinomadura roseirufa]
MNRARSESTLKTGTGRGVLEGAFLLLEELAQADEAGLTQLSSATGLPKSTTHRLLDQLVAVGAVHRGDRGRYRVGARAFRLGQMWTPAPVLRTAAARPARQLAAAIGESVSVAVMNGPDALVVTGVMGPADEVWSLRPGVVLPSASAAEIAIKATRPRAEAPGDHSRPDWARRVTSARDLGVAYDYENVLPPLACVAAPVHDPTGATVAAIAAVVMDSRRLASLTDAVRGTADRISANLTRIPGAGRALRLLSDPDPV